MKVEIGGFYNDMWFLNDNLSSNTNPSFLEEWEGEIILLFRIHFEGSISSILLSIDMLSTLVLEELISSLLERSHNLMQFVQSINSKYIYYTIYFVKKQLTYSCYYYVIYNWTDSSKDDNSSTSTASMLYNISSVYEKGFYIFIYLV